MLVEINPNNPEPRKIRRAVEALEAGEVIAYPTDTVYGLGCDPFNKRPSSGSTRSRAWIAVTSSRSSAGIWATFHSGP